MNEKETDVFDSVKRDEIYWQKMNEIFDKGKYSSESILRNWSAYVMRRDLTRFISHYELFKKVIDLPGSIVELGVFRGASFFTWANLMETFLPFDRSRSVYGFDSFEGLQDFSTLDGKLSTDVAKEVGGYKASREELELLTDVHNMDNLIPNTSRAELVIGDLKESLPKFLEDNPGFRISLLHFDVDLYEPTKLALELLYPLVVKGGVICFDEYAHVPWEGETKAVDEFFDTLPERPIIHKHPFTKTPTGFMVK
jgi:hypothetical protein